MKFVDENARFRAIVKIYRKTYNLTQTDLGDLLDLTQADISAIESGKKFIDFNLADKIAGVFGRKYYKIADPDVLPPDVSELPDSTQKMVSDRQLKGITESNFDLNFPAQIELVLNSGELPDEFTAKDVYNLFSKELKDLTDSGRITQSFKQGDLKSLVEYANKKREKEKGERGPKELIYRLIKPLDSDANKKIAKAKEKAEKKAAVDAENKKDE